MSRSITCAWRPQKRAQNNSESDPCAIGVAFHLTSPDSQKWLSHVESERCVAVCRELFVRLCYTVEVAVATNLQAPEPARIIETPLARLHQQADAKMGVWFGCALPDDFGDWEREYWFAHKSVALIDKNYRCHLSFTGPDRLRYLNAILTNNIKDLAPSHGNVSLLLNPQGRILAEIETYALPESLLCVSYAMIQARLAETLEKYIIMDDVTLTDDTQRFGTLALEGPSAAAIVTELSGVDLESPTDLERQDAGVGTIPCTIIRRSPGKSVGADFLVERPQLEALWQTLQEKSKAAGGGPIGYSALSAIRLERGVPWFSYDFGEKQIPHEAALEKSHISYTKGCYTGQEIVERVRSRGQVNRRRVGLRFSGQAVPSVGEMLTSGGKEAGYVTRAAFSPALSSAIGMGYVRKENDEVGQQLEWQGGAATVAIFQAR
jgi:folate-binding protein YgfZ